MQVTGACAGYCDDLTTTEGQIAIGNGDQEPTKILGETERTVPLVARVAIRRMSGAK